MKKSFTLLLAFAMGLGMVANAQTFVTENFSSTSGTALPAGWSQTSAAASSDGFKTGTANGLSSTSLGVSGDGVYSIEFTATNDASTTFSIYGGDFGTGGTFNVEWVAMLPVWD